MQEHQALRMPPVTACAHAAWHEQGLKMPPASRCLEHPHLNDMNHHLAFLEPPNWARALPPPLWLVPWEQGHLPSAPTALREGQPQTWTWQEEVGSLVTTSRPGGQSPHHWHMGSPQGRNPGLSRETMEEKNIAQSGNSPWRQAREKANPSRPGLVMPNWTWGAAPRCAAAMQIPGPQPIS